MASMLNLICGGICGLRQPSENELHEQQVQINKRPSDYGTRGGKSGESDSTLFADVVVPSSKPDGEKQTSSMGGEDAKTAQPDASKMSSWDKHTRPNVKRILEAKYGTTRSESTGQNTARFNRPVLPVVPPEKVLSGASMHARFQIIRKIATTNTGTVFIGQHRTTRQTVAVKVHHKRGSLVGVYNEASIHAELTHPNIVELLGFSDIRDDVFLVQEFCSGGELFDAVKPDQGCEPLAAREYMLQLCKAMAYVHERDIAHRDIKPENIMLSENKTQIRLIDFGLSERIRAAGSRYKRHVGTVPYMAAELWDKESKDPYAVLDLKAIDVWAAGVVCYCTLAGRFPWSEATARSLEFRRYTENDFTHGPWARMDSVPLELVKNMLHLDVSKRWTFTQAVEYIENTWKPASISAVNKFVARSTLRVDTKVANSSISSDEASYLTFSPQPEITSRIYDQVIDDLNHVAEGQKPVVPPGA